MMGRTKKTETVMMMMMMMMKMVTILVMIVVASEFAVVFSRVAVRHLKCLQ